MSTLTLGTHRQIAAWDSAAAIDADENEPACLTLSPRNVEVLQTLNEIFNAFGFPAGNPTSCFPTPDL